MNGSHDFADDQEHFEAAMQRAKAKVAAIRNGSSGDSAAGPSLAADVPVTIIAVLFGGLMLAIGLLLLGSVPSSDLIIPLMVLGLGALLLGAPVIVYVRSRPRTPQVAVRQFYKALGVGAYRRAQKLVTQSDFDDFPRWQPTIQNLGKPSRRRMAFAQHFDWYWRELTRSHTMPYCLVRVTNATARQQGDLAVVDFRLKLIMNTQLWLLLILIAWPIAAVADLTTRKVVTVSLQKVLVHVGGEWKLLNGEWQGAEEETPDWVIGPARSEQLDPNLALPVPQ